jgi:hypothetical protein
MAEQPLTYPHASHLALAMEREALAYFAQLRRNCLGASSDFLESARVGRRTIELA